MKPSIVTSRAWSEQRALLVLAVAFIFLVLVVDPWREMMTQDDGWAYARTVQRLLESGRYQLDEWSAADMRVQVYLAAGLSKLFGHSLSLLRLSTVALLFLGLWAFYKLLRELAFSSNEAAHLTLAFMSSGLLLVLGFTFMTDVQFLAWLLVALWLYARGLGTADWRLMFAGSVAAALAIGTRQFGICLLLGVFVACVLARPEQRRWGRFLIAGLCYSADRRGLAAKGREQHTDAHADRTVARAAGVPLAVAARP